VDNSQVSLEAYLDGNCQTSVTVPALAAQDSVLISVSLIIESFGVHEIRLLIHNLHEINAVDNLWISSLLVGKSPLIFNEIMYAPNPSNQEWLELYNMGLEDISFTDLRLEDASHHFVTFDLEIAAGEYKVLCHDADLLLQSYPQTPVSAILELPSLVSLNNDTETLLLYYGDTILDSLHYTALVGDANCSLERASPLSDIWNLCTLPIGGTPGLPNSVIIPANGVAIAKAEIIRQNTQLKHELHIRAETEAQNLHLLCFLYEYGTLEGEKCADEMITYPADSVYVFETSLPADGYVAFQYQIRDGADSLLAEKRTFYNQNYLPFCVNEIMYNPDTGEAEWLEIRRNADLPFYPEIILRVGSDSLRWQADERQYIVFESNQTAADKVQSRYQLESENIELGLPALLNSGMRISLHDSDNANWEDFSYLPEWSKDKGISMERVQPLLNPGSTNWGPCLNTSGGTPAAQNSIYLQQLPQQNLVQISPNPFHRSRQSHCEISFTCEKGMSVITCSIFDLQGRCVRILSDESLQAGAGKFLWDGKNNNGRDLPVGVYVLYLEANPRQGKSGFHKQKTIVLGK
jgi:hypothetical protein